MSCRVWPGRPLRHHSPEEEIPLNPTPDPAGMWIPIAGRAWQRWELLAKGEPWSDWADAPAHVAHPTTCPLWNVKAPDLHHDTAQGHLACMACGTIDATVRHTAELDLCADCRRPEHVEQPSTVDRSENIPAFIPGKIIEQETA